MRWNYYKLRQLSLLQIAMDGCYKLRQVLQSAMDLLQIATGITKCDDYYKLRQYKRLPCDLTVIHLRLCDREKSLGARHFGLG